MRAIAASQGQTYTPRPGWVDSYTVNGTCFCSSSFDHDVDDINIIFYRINGVKRNLRDVCDELENHPNYRARRNSDPRYNDIQCGNGPANTAADESGCPGRVDLGTAGCDQIGPKFPLAWLQSRARFSANSSKLIESDNATKGGIEISPNPIIFGKNAYLNTTANTNDEALISIFTLSGQKVASIKHQEVQGTVSSINISGLIKTINQTGMYILTYNASTTNYTKK